MPTPAAHPLADIDPRMLTEAFQRAREKSGNADLDAELLFGAIVAEARRGVRDLLSLVQAANAARPAVAA